MVTIVCVRQESDVSIVFATGETSSYFVNCRGKDKQKESRLDEEGALDSPNMTIIATAVLRTAKRGG